MPYDNDSDDNIILFPLSRQVKVERVARAMAKAENNEDDSRWPEYIEQATRALQIVKEIK